MNNIKTIVPEPCKVYTAKEVAELAKKKLKGNACLQGQSAKLFMAIGEWAILELFNPTNCTCGTCDPLDHIAVEMAYNYNVPNEWATLFGESIMLAFPGRDIGLY